MKSAVKEAIPGSAYVVLGLSCIALFAACIMLAPHRLIARDEGFYLYAARLILEGKHIYSDFFYPQAPLLPYCYSIFLKVFGISWEAGRMGAGIITATIGSLLLYICTKRHSLHLGLLALLLYCSSHFVLAWYLTVQTYSLSVLFLLIGYTLFSRKTDSASKPHWQSYVAGVFFGLAIGTRLFFAGLGPLWCLWMLFETGTLKDKFIRCTLLTAGCLTALVVFLPFVLIDAESVYFNNLGYHFIRSTLSPEETIANRMRVLMVVLGLVESIKFDAPQLAVLVYAGMISGLLRLCRGKNPSLAFYTAFGLFALNFLPSPTYVQYFCTLIPFLILCVIELLAVLEGVLSALQKNIAIPLVVCLILALGIPYSYHLHTDFLRYTYTGDGVIGIRSFKEAKHWNVAYMSKVSEKLDALEETPSTVITPWPGYVVSSRHHVLHGLENHFALLVGHQLSSEERQALHIVSKKEMIDAIAHTDTKLVAVLPGMRRGKLKQALEKETYQPPVDLKPLLIYRRQSP